MDISTLLDLFNNLGFPVACVVGLFYLFLRQDNYTREEIEGLRKSLDENTLILTKLYERMDNGEQN